MTAKTTRIYVALTDEQMDDHLRTYASAGTASAILWYAIKEQRPHPIAVGDHVGNGATVEAIKDGHAWIWRDGYPWGNHPVDKLTRADDEATA